MRWVLLTLLSICPVAVSALNSEIEVHKGITKISLADEMIRAGSTGIIEIAGSAYNMEIDNRSVIRFGNKFTRVYEGKLDGNPLLITSTGMSVAGTVKLNGVESTIFRKNGSYYIVASKKLKTLPKKIKKRIRWHRKITRLNEFSGQSYRASENGVGLLTGRLGRFVNGRLKLKKAVREVIGLTGSEEFRHNPLDSFGQEGFAVFTQTISGIETPHRVFVSYDSRTGIVNRIEGDIYNASMVVSLEQHILTREDAVFRALEAVRERYGLVHLPTLEESKANLYYISSGEGKIELTWRVYVSHGFGYDRVDLHAGTGASVIVSAREEIIVVCEQVSGQAEAEDCATPSGSAEIIIDWAGNCLPGCTFFQFKEKKALEMHQVLSQTRNNIQQQLQQMGVLSGSQLPGPPIVSIVLDSPVPTQVAATHLDHDSIYFKILSAFTSSDYTTLIHEYGHLLVRTLNLQFYNDRTIGAMSIREGWGDLLAVFEEAKQKNRSPRWTMLRSVEGYDRDISEEVLIGEFDELNSNSINRNSQIVSYAVHKLYEEIEADYPDHQALNNLMLTSLLGAMVEMPPNQAMGKIYVGEFREALRRALPTAELKTKWLQVANSLGITDATTVGGGAGDSGSGDGSGPVYDPGYCPHSGSSSCHDPGNDGNDD